MPRNRNSRHAKSRSGEKRNAEMIEASPAKLLVFQSFGDHDNECQDNSSPQEYRKAECRNAEISM
jgi:hypothetical protein